LEFIFVIIKEKFFADYSNIKLEKNETNNYDGVVIRCWVNNDSCQWKKVSGVMQYVCKPYSTLDNFADVWG